MLVLAFLIDVLFVDLFVGFAVGFVDFVDLVCGLVLSAVVVGLGLVGVSVV